VCAPADNECAKRVRLQVILQKQKYLFTDEQLKKLTPLVDMDSSGALSCEEFLLLSVFLRFAKIQFLLADADGSGDISKKELLAHLVPLGVMPTADVVDKYMAKLGATDKLTFEQFALLAAMIKLE
jgi:Ca2+-binding EF-hand superfamily protein